MGTHSLQLYATLQDGQVERKDLTIEFSFGCTSSIGLVSNTVESLGVYVINTNANQILNDLEDYFTPFPPGCISTFTLDYENSGSVPSWLTFTQSTASPNSEYDPTVTLSFNEDGSFTNVGVHALQLYITLQDGKTALK